MIRANETVNTAFQLVAIPVIVSFDELVPASQVDSALYDFNSTGEWGSFLQDVFPDRSKFELMPRLFWFDHLERTPLDVLKNGLAHRVGKAALVLQQREFCIESSMKRSNAFLRYLIGRHDIQVGVCDPRYATRCTALQDFVTQLLRLRLGVPCDVDAQFGASYIESLYTGLWRYQVKRLDHVVSRIRNSTDTNASLTAKVAIHGQRKHFAFRVGFFIEGKAIDGQDFMLRARPNEDARRCLGRIKDRIEASGIQMICNNHFASWDTDSNDRNSAQYVRRFAAPI